MSLFDLILNTTRWDERMRARKTASFGRPYNYSGIVYEAIPMPYIINQIIEKLERRFEFRPDNCLANLYETGDSTMGFHSDSNSDLEEGTGVAIVSLGGARKIVFRTRAKPVREERVLLEGGSVLYMAPEVQDHWKHAIRAEAEASARISLTFRQLKR